MPTEPTAPLQDLLEVRNLTLTEAIEHPSLEATPRDIEKAKLAILLIKMVKALRSSEHNFRYDMIAQEFGPLVRALALEGIEEIAKLAGLNPPPPEPKDITINEIDPIQTTFSNSSDGPKALVEITGLSATIHKGPGVKLIDQKISIPIGNRVNRPGEIGLAGEITANPPTISVTILELTVTKDIAKEIESGLSAAQLYIKIKATLAKFLEKNSVKLDSLAIKIGPSESPKIAAETVMIYCVSKK